MIFRIFRLSTLFYISLFLQCATLCGQHHWFGHDSGKQGSTHHQLNSIVEDAKNNLWFSTEEGGISWSDPQLTKLSFFTNEDRMPSTMTTGWHVEFEVMSLSEYGTYVITNQEQTQYLTVLGDTLFNKKYGDGALVGVRPKEGIRLIPRHQKWHFIRQGGSRIDAYYQIRNLHSGKLLTATGNDPKDPDALVQSSAISEESDRQLWRLTKKSNLVGYQLENKFFSAAVGNLSAQEWMITPVAPDSYRDDLVVNYFNRNDSSQGAVAFDQGNSIPLSWGVNNGKVIWVTQDAWDGRSLRDNNKFQCGSFFSYGNSMLLQPSMQDWDNLNTPNLLIPGGANGRPRQVTEIQSGHTFSWPSVGVEIGDKVYMHCGEGTGLEAKDQSLYILTQKAGEIWEIQRTQPHGLKDQVDIIYSSGMVKAADGYVYTFGMETVGFGYESYLHVGRYHQSDPQKWTFYDGTSWRDYPVKGAASKVADALGTISVSYLHGKYIMLTMDQGFNCDAGRDVFISTSDSPTGPFTNRKLVYTINEYFYGQYARYYTPSLHPHFDNGRKELLFTYSLNYSACGLEECQDGVIDPYYYRIKGVRIPYAMMGIE